MLLTSSLWDTWENTGEEHGRATAMMNHSTLRRTAVQTALAYILLMGLGMLTLHRGFAIRYGQPEMVKVLVFFEIALTLLSVSAVKRYFGWRSSGFGSLKNSSLGWFLPFALLAVGVTAAFWVRASITWKGLALSERSLLPVIGFCTLLVGISEEVTFRGILIGAFQKQQGKRSAMLVSATLFSLLHAVNILGGISLSAMLTQLGLTFLLGLAFAPLAVKLGNILPLIVFHWLWDFAVVGAPVVGLDLPIFSLALIVIELVAAVLLWSDFLRNRPVLETSG